MDKASQNFPRDVLKLVSVCPVCREAKRTKIDMLESETDECTVHVRCGQCGHKLLANMNVLGGGVNCVGIVTDMSSDDAKRLLTSRELSSDDVFQVKEAMASGEFEKALAPRG